MRSASDGSGHWHLGSWKCACGLCRKGARDVVRRTRLERLAMRKESGTWASSFDPWPWRAAAGLADRSSSVGKLHP